MLMRRSPSIELPDLRREHCQTVALPMKRINRDGTQHVVSSVLLQIRILRRTYSTSGRRNNEESKFEVGYGTLEKKPFLLAF